MNKGELIEKLAGKVDLSKNKTAEVLNELLEIISGTLKGGDDVVLTGFGRFDVRKRKAREGRNPQTGAKISIPARKVPKFKAGKTLKETVK
jgi:DNA-binding protein HU-beta